MLSARPHNTPDMAVTSADRAFYVDLGQRISALRRDRDLTPVQLAEAMGVAQQTVAHYESGRLRLLAGALPNLAGLLGVRVEDLIGTPQTKRAAGKRERAPKLQQLERLQAPPKTKQRMVSEVLDSFLAQAGRQQ